MARFYVLAALTVAVAATPATAAQTLAQLTLPSSPPASQLGIQRAGAYLVAPITLDGATLFQVATPAQSNASNQISIAQRVAEVQGALEQVVATTGEGAAAQPVFDASSLRVHVRHEGTLDVLEVVDAKHQDPLSIVTVTPADAAFNATTIDSLASQWQETLQAALVKALLARQPAVRRSNTVRVLQLAGILAGVSLLVWMLSRALRARSDALQEAIEVRTSAADAESQRVAEDPEKAHLRRRRFFALALRNVEPERRRATYSALAEALVWALALAWFVAMTWAFSLFPQTSPLAAGIVRGTVAIAITIVVAGLLNRVLDIVIARIAGVWQLRRFGDSEDRARFLLRIPTITRAVSNFKAFVLVVLAVLSIIGALGLPIGSVLTIGGLFALGLSLAAQNFVRDFLNGFLVLAEDQYVVGDFITINANSGLVERLTLRMVQLRDAAGDLITIPHSSVTSVINQSRNWSRVDYRVPVDPASDVDKAVELVRSAIETLAAERDWRDSVLDPIEWIGIDALSRDGAIVRASVKTLPLRQFEFRRLINDRVHSAFARDGIALGVQTPGVV